MLAFLVLQGWSSYGRRWVVGFLLLFGGILALGAFRLASIRLERFFLVWFALFSSIRVDVHLYHSGETYGFPFSLNDVAWVALMGCWIARQRRSTTRLDVPRGITFWFSILALTSVVAGLRASFLPTGLRAIFGILQAYLLFLYVWNLPMTGRDYRLLGYGYCGAILLQALIGCAQAATQSNLGLEFLGATEAAFSSQESLSRVGGTLGWSNRFALFVNTLILVPVALAFTTRNRLERLALGAVFTLTVTALVLTKSRGGWMSFGLVFLAFVFIALRERWGGFHRTFFLFWTAAIALLLVFAIPATRERVLADDQGSAYGRIPMALTAVAMMRDHPAGVGTGNYVSRMLEYDASDDGMAVRFRHPVHNAYLLVGAEQGILAMIALVAILILCFRHLWPLVRSGSPPFPRLLGLALMAGMATSVIYWLMIAEQPMSKLHNWFQLAMAVHVSRFVLRGSPPMPSSGAGASRPLPEPAERP